MSDWEVVQGATSTAFAPGGSNPVRRLSKHSVADTKASVERLSSRLRDLEAFTPEETTDIKSLELAIRSTLEFVFGSRQTAEPYWEATQLSVVRPKSSKSTAPDAVRRAVEIERGRVRAIILLQQAVSDISQSADTQDKRGVIENPISIADASRINNLIEQLIGQVDKSNVLSPAEKAQVTGEMRAGIELVRLPRLDLGAVERYLLGPLRFLIGKFAEAVIGRLAESAVELIGRLLGF